MNTLGKLVATTATSIVLVAPLALAGPAVAATDFANCDAMHKVYKHGVARSQKAANKQVKQGYGKPKVSKPLYKANAESDADVDGTACEA